MSDPHPSVRLILVRHGQAGGPNHHYGPDVPLSERGLEQAKWIAVSLAREGVSTILTSPFHRARQTARATADRLQCALTEDERLSEFQMGGDGDDVSIEELIRERRYLMLWRPHDQLADGGETLAQFQRRVSALLDDIVERSPRATVALFTHAGTIAAAMRWAYGLSPDHDWHSDIEVFNASFTEIEHWPSGRHPKGAPYASAVRRLNDVRHLPAELVTEY